MTTDDADGSKKSDHQDTENATHFVGNINLAQEIMDILEYLSLNANIVFKSQQRGEPELMQAEKVKLAKDVYQRNPQIFLVRFGNYLEEKHLNDFARLSIADSDEEMHSMVNEYQRKIKTRRQDVKNRRYAAMQELIKDGEYFSEQEMMKRSPELYQELIGQHLSKEEKQQRDCYDVKNTTFSGILMHSLEQKQISEIMEKVENQDEDNSEDSNEKQSSFEAPAQKGALDNLAKEEEEVPIQCRQQWGNFDNEQIACSSSKVQKKKLPIKPKGKEALLNLITADERELLRQEFISQMHEQFLSGQDSDFDYSTVDDNTQYDDIQTLNQDREDKYFEESDDEEHDDITENQIKHDSNKMEEGGEESEDELDVYMSHLNKHHSLQN